MRDPMLRKSARTMSRESGLTARTAGAPASGARWRRGITVLMLALTSLAASSAAAGPTPSAPADLPAAPDSATAVAPGPHWVQATPSGGSILALAQAPSSPQTLYALADTGDLFGSDNGGASWSARRGAPPDAPITSLVVDPNDAATVYAVTYASSGSSLLRTRNGARSWKGIGFGVFVFTLLPDAKQPNVLYAASLDGLHRSSDGGTSWTVLAFAGFPVVSLAMDPFDGRRLLATVGGNATGDPIVVWRSLDRGETWQPTSLASMPGGIDSFVPFLLVFDPARRATAYALSILTLSDNTGPVFRTQDGGVSWSLLPAASGIRDLAASSGGALYAATDFGVAHSNDAGASWQPPLADPTVASAAPPDAIGRVVASGSLATVFAAGHQGIWKSTDGGERWFDSNRGLVALNVSSIAAAPMGPDTVVAVAGRGIFGSHDHGQSWERLHSDFEGPQPDRLVAFDPRNPRTIYGFGFDGQADHFFASADGGHTWQQPPFPYGCGGDSICDVEMTTFALDPTNPGTVFVGGIFFYHFGGSGHFLLRSDDGGATWSGLATPDQRLSPMLLAIDPAAPARFYVLTCGGLYRSQDSGATWYPVGRGLPSSGLCGDGPPTLALDPSRPRIVYVGTPGHGVYRSTDDGASFHPFGHGLESAKIAAFVVDPENSAALYAGVAGQGVWSWNAGLRTWMPLSAGLPVKNFDGVLALDPQDPAALYAGTVFSGVYRLLPP